MRRTIGLLLALALVAAPAAAKMKVAVDLDEGYDFSGRATYAWKEGRPAQDELNQKRIVAGVEERLAALGLTPAEEGATPDLWVSTEAFAEDEVKSSGSRVGLSVSKRTSWGSIGLGGSRGNRTRKVTVGTLVIAVLDGESGELVWRAVASDTLTDDPEKTARQIADAIERAFAKFPRGS